jgi:hypothetical protein
MLGKSFWLIFDAVVRLVEFVFTRNHDRRLTKKNGNDKKTTDTDRRGRNPLDLD